MKKEQTIGRIAYYILRECSADTHYALRNTIAIVHFYLFKVAQSLRAKTIAMAVRPMLLATNRMA
jgi:hypothetical protein